MAQPSYYIQELLRQGNAADARNYLGISGGAGSVKFSAGTLSINRSDITFSNANGVSFGLNGAGVITASVAPGATASNKYSAGTLSALRTDLTFNNGGGVSFGLDAAGVITASVNTNYQTPGPYLTTAQPPGAYLTTAMQSNASSAFAGTGATIFGGSLTVNTAGVNISLPAYLTTAQPPGAYLTTAMASDASSAFAGLGFTSATTSGTNIVATLSTNGLSVGVPKFLTTAAGGLSFIGLSAGANSLTATGVTFENTNAGITFGMNTINSAFTAAVNTNTAGIGFTSATTAGTNIVATLSTNGLSMGVPDYLTTAPGAFTPRLDQVLDPNTDKVFNMASNQVQFQYALGGSFSTNATRQGMFEIDVQGNLTQEADALHIHQHAANPTALDLIHAEANGTKVTAYRAQVSATVAAEFNQPIKFTTEDAAYAIGSVPMILGTTMSNMVANLNADMVDGKHSSEFVQTASSSLVVPTLSTWANLPQFNNIIFNGFSNQTSGIFPLHLEVRVPCSVWRFAFNFSMTQQSVQSTAVNNATGTTTGLTYAHQFNVALYKLSAGQNQSVITMLNSTSTGLSWLATVSCASTTNAVNMTVTQQIVYGGRFGAPATSQTVYATTSQSAGILSSFWTDKFTAQKFIDIPWATTLEPGNYVVVHNISTGRSAAQLIAIIGTLMNQQQTQSNINDMGQATDPQYGGWFMPLGSYSAGGTGFANSMTLTSGAYNRISYLPYVQLLYPV